MVPTLPGGVDDPLGSGTTAATNAVTQPVEPISFFPETSPEIGTEIGRIVISAVELDLVVFQGADRATLKKGPGHMSWTPMPGQVGNTVISGHRVTNGQPFFNLHLLVPGDEIEVETVTGIHTYWKVHVNDEQHGVGPLKERQNELIEQRGRINDKVLEHRPELLDDLGHRGCRDLIRKRRLEGRRQHTQATGCFVRIVPRSWSSS